MSGEANAFYRVEAHAVAVTLTNNGRQIHTRCDCEAEAADQVIETKTGVLGDETVKNDLCDDTYCPHELPALEQTFREAVPADFTVEKM